MGEQHHLRAPTGPRLGFGRGEQPRADAAPAAEIETKVRGIVNLEQNQGVIEVGDFSADAQKAVREVLKVHAAA